MKLNKEQLPAVNHGGGPLLIVAGAGTGKTTVITQRIVRLITSKKAKTTEILALTFTEKAASEMQERVDIALPLGYFDMWISTFHSFCDRILRDEALEVGLAPDFKILNNVSQIQFVKSNLFEFDLDYYRPLGNPNKFISGLLTHLSRLKDEDVSWEQYKDFAARNYRKAKTSEEKLEAKKIKELANAYRQYEELKIKQGFFDYGDLIVKTIETFEKRPNILKKYREKFKYILVDEFQDTNFAQNKLAMMLAGKNGNITVVGDDDQSIYRFRGAAISNILDFKKRYPKSKSVVLIKNYRSKQNMLDAAYDLISHNNPDRLEVVQGLDKKLVSVKKGKGEIDFHHAKNGITEIEYISEQVLNVVENGNYDFRDIAVLVRSNYLAEPIVKGLSRNGIPNQFLGPEKLFNKQEIIDLISFLRVLHDIEDSISMYRLLNMEILQIDSSDIAKITSHARRRSLSVFEAAEKVAEINLSKDSTKKVKKLTILIKGKIQKSKRALPGKILYEFINEIGLLSQIADPKDHEAEQATKNITSFFNRIKSFEDEHSQVTIAQVVDWINTVSDLGQSPIVSQEDWQENDAVNILTNHSAKGLEFPIVFLVNLVADRFPSRSRRDQIPLPDGIIKETLPKGDWHMQEERRLFYVGLTRAQEKLYLTASDFYTGNKRKKKPSPFVFETLGDQALARENLNLVDKITTLEEPKKTIKTKPPQSFHVDYLSYSQIDAFNICPLHYKLRYILNIPTPPTAALSMGNSVHAALHNFYKQILAGRRATKNLLLKSLEDNWINEGFETKKHERLSFEESTNMLENYFLNELKKTHDSIALEQPFNISLRKKGEQPIRIGGKIDRIDKVGEGIEIVDYKTGDPKDQKFTDANEQLTFYALAASMLVDSPFGAPAKDITLTLLYLKTGEKFSTTRTIGQINDYKDEIFKVRGEIEESDFACSKNYICRSCEFFAFCEA